MSQGFKRYPWCTKLIRNNRVDTFWTNGQTKVWVCTLLHRCEVKCVTILKFDSDNFLTVQCFEIVLSLTGLIVLRNYQKRFPLQLARTVSSFPKDKTNLVRHKNSWSYNCLLRWRNRIGNWYGAIITYVSFKKAWDDKKLEIPREKLLCWLTQFDILILQIKFLRTVVSCRIYLAALRTNFLEYSQT